MAEDGRRRGKHQRDELALAAADWVIENGLSDLSLRRLAAGLEVSHRVLLYHFGSKEELFQAILRAARTRERLRSVTLPDEDHRPPATTAEALRRTWQYLSAPREHAFWRFYFEIHGIALQDPERYADVLHEGIHDWLDTARELLIRDGVPDEPARAIASLIIGAVRGLMLDLLQTGERDRVDAGFQLLAGLAEHLAPAPASPDTTPRA